MFLLALLATFMGLAGVYAFFGSTLNNEGEMRYHLSMVPVLVTFAGAGAQILLARFVPARKNILGLGVALVLFVGSLFPYIPLVRAADHPFQQEYLVLKDKVLDPGLISTDHAMVFVPPANEKLMDIHPTSIAPLLSDPALTTNVTTWHRSKLAEAVGHLDDIPVYFYCGLYAHYLAGPNVGTAQWWEGRMTELGLGTDASTSPYLKEVFVEERAFVPNHQVLDKGFETGTMRVALYQLVK